MQITRVSAQVRDASTAAEFFDTVLGLGVERVAGSVMVKIGTTLLELAENPAAQGDHHFAVTIPSNKFVEAKRWLTQRAELLGTLESDEFESPPGWNARSLYFAGPDRSVLELIIRRDLDNSTDGPFTTDDLLCISEVGVGSSDVLALATFLNEDADVRSYGAEPGSDFSPVGDTHGLLILVSPDRAWFPTTDRVATPSPITIEATGHRQGIFPLDVGGSLRIRQ